jgi:glycosyltransferase involved in cell wall biosynthesis
MCPAQLKNVDPTKLKVCFLAGTLGRGGAERQLVYMLRALKQGGVQSRVLCLTQGEFFEHEIKSLGVPVEYVGGSTSQLIRLLRIVRSLSRDPVNILQSVHFYTNLYAAFAARVVRARSIGAIRNDLVSELKANGLAGWGHLHMPSHLLANSTIGQQRAVDRGIPQLRVDLLPNAVDSDVFVARQNDHGPDDAVRILFVGRLDKQKRPDLFIRVISRVVRQLPDRRVKAVIVGDGRMKTEVKDLIANVGLTAEQIEIAGARDNMSAFYQNADLLLLTSDWEGTPNVLLEAMACGVPVVSTRVGGVPEIVDTDRGLVVNSGDEDALTEAVLKLVENTELRHTLGTRGREYVLRFHSLEMLKGRLTDVYQRVLQPRTRHVAENQPTSPSGNEVDLTLG